MELSLEKQLVIKELEKDIELELAGWSNPGKPGYNLVEVIVHRGAVPFKSHRWMKEGEKLPEGARIVEPAKVPGAAGGQEIAPKPEIKYLRVAEYERIKAREAERIKAREAEEAKGPRIFDEGPGKAVDRYTLITPDGSVYGFDEDPYAPNGFGQYAGDYGNKITYGQLGQAIKMEDLPLKAQRFVMEKMGMELPKGHPVAVEPEPRKYNKEYFDLKPDEKEALAKFMVDSIKATSDPDMLEILKVARARFDIGLVAARDAYREARSVVRGAPPQNKERLLTHEKLVVPKPKHLWPLAHEVRDDRLDKIMLGKAIGAYRKGDVAGVKADLSEKQLWHAMKGAESGMAKWKEAAKRGEAKAVESYSGYEIMHKVIGQILNVGGILGVKSVMPQAKVVPKKDVPKESKGEEKLHAVGGLTDRLHAGDPEAFKEAVGGEKEKAGEVKDVLQARWRKALRVGETARASFMVGEPLPDLGEIILIPAHGEFVVVAQNYGGKGWVQGVPLKRVEALGLEKAVVLYELEKAARGYGTCKTCWKELRSLGPTGECAECEGPKEKKSEVSKPITGLDANNPKGIYPEQSL
jgi:hypothetical protein